MDDTSPKSDATQSNIDELVKELSRTQSAPSPAPSSGATAIPPRPAPAPAPIPAAPKLMPPKPAMPAPTPPKEYQSSIRTMSDDLSKLKSGQQPQGVTVPRTVEPPKPIPAAPKLMPPKPAMPAPSTAMPQRPVMPPPKPAMPIKPAMPPRPAPAPAPIPAAPKPMPSVPTPPAPNQPNKFYVPESAPSTGGNKNLIFIGIAAAAVVLAVVYWYFMIRQPQVALETPVATFTPRPTATPDPLMAAFPTQGGTVTLPASGDPTSAFSAALATQTVNPGQLSILNVLVASGSNQGLGAFDLLDRFRVSYPTALKQAEQKSVILDFGQQESFDAKGAPITGATLSQRLVLVSEVASSSMPALSQWEPTMTTGLAGLFGFDKTKNTKSFLGTNYQGIPVRYKNFAYPNRSIDYALVTSGAKTYLILSSSRQAMFAAVDAFRASGQ